MQKNEGHQNGHPEGHKDHRIEYFLVFIALAVLTLIELYIPTLKNITYFSKASSLILLAVGKAFVVAYFYMHLKEEKAWLKFIAALPILAAFYAFVLILESIYR